MLVIEQFIDAVVEDVSCDRKVFRIARYLRVILGRGMKFDGRGLLKSNLVFNWLAVACFVKRVSSFKQSKDPIKQNKQAILTDTFFLCSNQ